MHERAGHLDPEGPSSYSKKEKRDDQCKTEPQFVMSMYPNMLELYKAKAAYYMEQAEGWEASCKNEAKQCSRHQRASVALQAEVNRLEKEVRRERMKNGLRQRKIDILREAVNDDF